MGLGVRSCDCLAPILQWCGSEQSARLESEVPPDAALRLLGVRHEDLGGEELEDLHVAAGGFEEDLLGDIGDHRPLPPEALLGEPAAHVLLVERPRFFAARHEFLAVRGVPVARGVRRVDLVDEDDRAVGIDPEFVLRVDEDEAALLRLRLPEGEHLLAHGDARLERGGVQDAAGDDLLRGQVHVMAVLRLGGRGEDDLWQWNVLPHVVGQDAAVEVALAGRVARPDGSRGHAGEVPAHDELDRDDPALPDAHDVRVGRVDEVGRGDAAARHLSEPHRGEPVQDLALPGDVADPAVEGREPVGRDDEEFVAPIVDVANLASPRLAESGQVHLVNHSSLLLAKLFIRDHVFFLSVCAGVSPWRTKLGYRTPRVSSSYSRPPSGSITTLRLPSSMCPARYARFSGASWPSTASAFFTWEGGK